MPSSIRPRAWGVIGAVTLLFLAAAADSVQAQTGGTIRGRTTEQVTQRPLGGVRVQLIGANRETRADETGTFTFRGLPAGAYTLYTLPNEDGSAKLIVNKQVGQWGTQYDEKQDLARIDLKKDALETPVDQFTIAIEKNPSGGGTLKMMWENTQFSAPLTVQQ